MEKEEDEEKEEQQQEEKEEEKEESSRACPTHVHAHENDGRFIAQFTQVYLGTTVRFRG